MAKLAELIPIWLFPFFHFSMTTFLQLGVSLLKGIPLVSLLMTNFTDIAKPKVFFFALFESHKKRLAILGPLTNLKILLNRDIVIGHLP